MAWYMFHPIYQLYLYTYIYHQNDTNSNGNDQDKNNNYNNKSSDDNADHGVYIYNISPDINRPARVRVDGTFE